MLFASLRQGLLLNPEIPDSTSLASQLAAGIPSWAFKGYGMHAKSQCLPSSPHQHPEGTVVLVTIGAFRVAINKIHGVEYFQRRKGFTGPQVSGGDGEKSKLGSHIQ